MRNKKKQSLSCLLAFPVARKPFQSLLMEETKTLFPPRLLVSRSSTCDLLLCYSFILSTCLKSPVVSPPSFRLLSASGSFFLSMFCEQKASCLCLLPVQRRAAAYPPVTHCCSVLKRSFPGEARAFLSLSVPQKSEYVESNPSVGELAVTVALCVSGRQLSCSQQRRRLD